MADPSEPVSGDDSTSMPDDGSPGDALAADEAGRDDADRGEPGGDDAGVGDSGRDAADRPEIARGVTVSDGDEDFAAEQADDLPDVGDLLEDEHDRALAEALLEGPGLTVSDDAPGVADQRASWGDVAKAGLERVRAELDDRKVGLAISGGGSLGSFEAGALRFLYDHLEVAPTAITGNSAGALNAAKLAHGDDPAPRAIDDVERIWRSMRVNSDMWEPEPWLERIMASAQWASAIRAHPGHTGQSAGAMRVAVRVLNSFVRRPAETDGAIDAVRDALKAQALLSLKPIASLIEQELDIDRIRSSGIALRVGAVALESGELRYIGEDGALYARSGAPLDLPKVSLADGVLASASIPVAFPPIALGDEHYVDGGAREILPLQVLVENLGVDRAIAISAGSPAIEPSSSFAARGIFDIVRRVTSEIGPNETLRKELSPPGGWSESVRLIIPDLEVHDTMTIDPALIAVSFDYGWMHAADTLLDLDAPSRRLTAELTETRIQLRRLDGPLPALLGAGAADTALTGGITESGWTDGAPTLRARLREQVSTRRDLGAPVPPSLLVWLDS